MTIDALKLKIITQIMSLSDSAKLEKLELFVEDISKENDLLKSLVKPIKKDFDLEEIKKEQNYAPICKEDFFKQIESLDIEESLDELLEMI